MIKLSLFFAIITLLLFPDIANAQHGPYRNHPPMARPPIVVAPHGGPGWHGGMHHWWRGRYWAPGQGPCWQCFPLGWRWVCN